MTIFNSRDENYKSPFGAVCCGATVNFTVTPGPEFCACALLTFGEFADAHGESALLPCPGGFSGVFTAPEKPELVWYSFRFTRPDGSCVYLGRNGLGEQASRQPWQLTVYESRPTPEWFGRGVTYQIFPDRFCRDAIPDPKGLLGQRTVHDNWDDPPRLGPDPLTGRWNSDFFGGSLRGICRKLDYLQSLSVTTLYLNPIFYAASSHRYDTADYRMIDPMLGTEGDLRMLCAEAKKRGIHVMLDGVFNHTGDDSRYFNRRVPEQGIPVVRLVLFPALAGQVRRLVGHRHAARRQRKRPGLSGLHHPGSGQRDPPLAAVRRGRLAAGRGRRAARRLY